MEVNTEKRSKLCGCSLETKALAFAVYSILKGIITFIFGVITVVTHQRPIVLLDVSAAHRTEFWKNIMYPSLAIVTSILALVFSTLLIIGLMKKKSSFLLAFFVYSVIVETVGAGSCVILVVGLAMVGELRRITGPWAAMILLHAVAILGIVIVFKTYKKFISHEVKPFSHQKLREETSETV